MRKVWLVADSVISPMGNNSQDNFNQVIAGASGIQSFQQSNFGEKSVSVAYCADLLSQEDYTRFEVLCRKAISGLTKQISIPKEKTLFILSTTKGNIEVLEKGQPNHPHIHLHVVADLLAKENGIENSIVVSNACTSGVVALVVAKRYIETGQYDHAVVLGADALTRFVIAGFQSLNALSANLCRPFDAARKGINLGEAAAAILVTARPDKVQSEYKVALLGGAISNDANHISGPSKTGEELASAIGEALEQANLGAEEIDFISAHGTATIYNDEMEAKAFHLSNLSETPMHSLKGNFGHTLGAAGVVETAMSIHSLRNGVLLPSLGFDTLGVSKPLHVIREKESKTMKVALKTSSGFGGCNSAIILQLES